jgi:predicted nucleic acid-binding protein
LWDQGGGVISVQVLQELYVTLTHQARLSMDHAQAREIVANFSTWSVYAPDAENVLAAIDAAGHWRVSFWDALIFFAAHASGASLVWSEDLNDGQSYDGVVVRNPFTELDP